MPSRIQRLIHESLLESAARLPEKDAVIDERERRTYGELADEARRFARHLQDEGLERGDRVVLFLDNSVTCVATFFGVLLAGGVASVVNPQTKADKLGFILDNAEASFLVAEGRAAATAAEAVTHAPSVKAIYATGGAVDLPRGIRDLHAAIESAPPEPGDPGTIPNDLAALIYTSGTTGKPKGVMMSHGALVFCVGSIVEYLRLEEDDRILSFLPLAFTYGLGQLLLTVRLGATLLLERSFAFPTRTMQRIREDRATVVPAVPTVYATILGMSHDAPYESVRCLTNAAAGLPPSTHAGLAEVFPNAKLFRMYGQTECQRVCYLEPEMIERKPTSIGKAIPGTEAFVLNEQGRPAAPGEVGILHVRGPHIMAGYWRAPELTAHHLRQGPLPGERMLCTHDYFTVDEDGDLYFVDRSDDIIKTRGEKVSSVEVENVIHAIDGVHAAAVIGVPDDILGKAVRAYIVLEEGAQLTEQAILRECRGRLENFMVPRDIVFRDALPQTESGKIRKKSLVEALAA